MASRKLELQQSVHIGLPFITDTAQPRPRVPLLLEFHFPFPANFLQYEQQDRDQQFAIRPRFELYAKTEIRSEEEKFKS